MKLLHIKNYRTLKEAKFNWECNKNPELIIQYCLIIIWDEK